MTNQFDWVEGDYVGYPEVDPTGRSHSDAGAKLDSGKVRYSLVFGSMPDALRAVVDVAEYGAAKYSEDGWKQVPEGSRRYTDALFRHLMAEMSGWEWDQDSGLCHAAQTAWNALARLQLMLDDETESTPEVEPKSDPFLEQQQVRQKKRIAIDRLQGIYRQLKKDKRIPKWGNWITSDDDGLIAVHSDAPEAGDSDTGTFWFSEGRCVAFIKFQMEPPANCGLSAAWEFSFPGGNLES